MVAPSKIFHPPLDVNHCSQSILHPGVGCFHDFLTNLVKHSIGGFKYFSPLLITPLVLKFKTMNNELFVNTLKYYLKTVWWTTMASSASFYCICMFRNQLGRFGKYTTLFVPTVVGMQFCWLFPERVMKLFATATTQAVFEGLLRQHANIFTKTLLHSRLVQTLIFMINSAIILHYKRLKVYREFWFMQPYAAVPHKDEKVTDVNANNVEIGEKTKSKCVHSNATTCSEFVWDGIKSYLLYGIPVDLLSVVMKSVPKGIGGGPQGIWSIVLAKLKSFRPNMTGFFIIYSGIYRLSSCLLHKHYGHRAMNLQHLLAAFLGGSAYLGVDKSSFFTLSTVIAIQALWQQFCNKRVVSNNSNNLNSNTRTSNIALRLLQDVPFSRIIFTLNMGYLIHNFIMNYEVLNSFTRGFLDALTANKTKSIRDTILKYTTEELMTIANTNTVKTFL